MSVEVALSLPVLLLVMFACVEFGRLNMLRITAENACYEGARRAAVPGSTSGEAESVAQSILNVASARNATITVTPAAINDSTREVTVLVEIPLAANAWVTPKFTGTKTLARSCTLSRERFMP